MITTQKLNIGKNFIVAAVAVFSLGIIGCGGKKEGEAKTGTEAAAANASDAKPEKTENWKYSESVDKMTSEKRFFAEAKSTNKINFDFPYEGGSTFTLTVRHLDKKNNILLSVSKGQFMTSIAGDEEKLRIKFDNEQPMNVNYTSPSDGSSDVIFIKSEEEIISKLKTAKKVIIETEFYQAGNKQIEFDVEGLKWDHK